MKRITYIAALAMGACASHRRSAETTDSLNRTDLRVLDVRDSTSSSLKFSIDSPVIIYQRLDSPAVRVTLSARRMTTVTETAGVGHVEMVDSAVTARRYVSQSESATDTSPSLSVPAVLVALPLSILIAYFIKKVLNLR